MITVANLRTSDFDIYIGRGSPLGNPYPMRFNHPSERTRVISLYEAYMHREIAARTELWKELHRIYRMRTAVLGCYCHPKPCHGDIIAEFLNGHLIRTKKIDPNT